MYLKHTGKHLRSEIWTPAAHFAFLLHVTVWHNQPTLFSQEVVVTRIPIDLIQLSASQICLHLASSVSFNSSRYTLNSKLCTLCTNPVLTTMFKCYSGSKVPRYWSKPHGRHFRKDYLQIKLMCFKWSWVQPWMFRSKNAQRVELLLKSSNTEILFKGGQTGSQHQYPGF